MFSVSQAEGKYKGFKAFIRKSQKENIKNREKKIINEYKREIMR